VPGSARGRSPRGLRVRATVLLSTLLVLLGIGLVVETAVLGGGIGYLLGGVLMLAGAGRLYLSLR
jgi:hypothetical protein